MSKQFGNIAHILVNLLYSVSRQHYETWASQFPSLYNIKDTVLPSEAFL